MAISKFIIFLQRTTGLLSCLILCLFTTRFLFTKEYIWAGLYLALTLVLLYRFIKDYSRAEAHYGANYVVIILAIMPGLREYSNYKRDLRLEKFGLVYNKTRQSLGIPIIPADWHIDDRGDRSGEWTGKKGVLGHEEKYIGFDSLHKIEFERDEYNFKGIHDTSRSISIFFKYARGRSRDSIFYSYGLKDTTLILTSHQADSIFDAAKIRKDF